jgi:hypothetical protein
MSALFNLPLALQGFVEIFQNPATAWIIIPMLIFSIPIISTLMGPLNARIKADERERLRKMYERLALEKLDVIKTAVAMGYQRSDLQELDARLEEVIGSEEMKKLLDAKQGAGSSKTGPKLTINVQKGEGQSASTVDLDELISGELTEGLRKRRRERNHQDD